MQLELVLQLVAVLDDLTNSGNPEKRQFDSFPLQVVVLQNYAEAIAVKLSVFDLLLRTIALEFLKMAEATELLQVEQHQRA